MSDIETVGVTGTGSMVGQAIIKSLRDSEIFGGRIIGFDYIPETVGSFWCDDNVVLPDILDSEIEDEVLLGALVEAIEHHGIELLFLGLDFELTFFARYREELYERSGCRVDVCSPEVVEVADDKFRTARFLEEHGFDCPRTFLNPQKAIQHLEFPILVKPRTGSRSRYLKRIYNEQELLEVFRDHNDIVAQEYLPQLKHEYTCGVTVLDGELCGVIPLRRDLKDGHTVFAEYRREYDFLNDCLAGVAGVLKPEGTVNIQLRLDSELRPRIFEINARHSGTTHIRTHFGYREIDMILARHLGRPIDPPELREGRIYRYYDEFFIPR